MRVGVRADPGLDLVERRRAGQVDLERVRPSRTWLCASTKPGSTVAPAASITSVSAPAAPPPRRRPRPTRCGRRRRRSPPPTAGPGRPCKTCALRISSEAGTRGVYAGDGGARSPRRDGFLDERACFRVRGAVLARRAAIEEVEQGERIECGGDRAPARPATPRRLGERVHGIGRRTPPACVPAAGACCRRRRAEARRTRTPNRAPPRRRARRPKVASEHEVLAVVVGMHER